MEEEVKSRLEALTLQICHLNNEMEKLKIEKELLLNEVKNIQLKFHLNILPSQCLTTYNIESGRFGLSEQYIK